MNWLRGGQPRPDSLQKLAVALGEDYGRLMQLAGYPTQASTDASTTASVAPARDPRDAIRELAALAESAVARRIPIQTAWAHAGNGGLDAAFIYELPQWIGKRVAAFRVVGDCLAPLVESGDTAVAGLDQTPRDGNLVVVNVDGQPQVRIYDAKRRRLTANDGTPPIPLTEATEMAPVLGIFKALVDVEE